MFPNDFSEEVATELKRRIKKNKTFVFVASDFEYEYAATNDYFQFILNMFTEKKIEFEKTLVI